MAKKRKLKAKRKVKKKNKTKSTRGHRLSIAEKALQKKLLTLQEDLAHVVQAKERDLPIQETGDEADIASLSLEREILFEQSDNERVTLDNIEAALHKLEQGLYGICESCGKKILRARLKAMPYARYCVACQAKNESNRFV